MKKILAIVVFSLLFTTNLEAEEFQYDINDYVIYDELYMCAVANPAMLDTAVMYNKVEGSDCLDNFTVLSSENYDGINYYTYDEIYFDTDGNIYEHIQKSGDDTRSNLTVEEIDFTQVDAGEYTTPVTISEFNEALPGIRNYNFLDEEENLMGDGYISDKEYIFTTETLYGIIVSEATGTAYDDPYKNNCGGSEDIKIFTKYPIKTSTEQFYDENGNIMYSTVINYEFNDDCVVYEEDKITSYVYTEYYESGVIAYELIEIYENREIVSTIENNYDTNGNLIIEEHINEEVIEVEAEEVTPTTNIVNENPVVATGVEQVSTEDKKLVETGSNSPKLISVTAILGALFLVRKFL